MIYNYAFEKGIYFNKIYEQILCEDCEKLSRKLLFHGTKNTINLPLDFKYSKENNDFGRDFYLGENFEQASTYIANTSSKYVYSFSLNDKDLIIEKFNVDMEWMLASAYYRGWLTQYKSKLLGFNKKSRIFIIRYPLSLRHGLPKSWVTMIFLNESSILPKEEVS